ncbi:MAG: radical SAM protein [Candidatus Aminicenantales bacterium]
MTKAQRDSKSSPPPDSPPFSILREEDFYILVHKQKPSWLVTNEEGKEIALKYFQENSRIEIAASLKAQYPEAEEIEEDVEKFIQRMEEIGFAGKKETDTVEVEDKLRGLLFLVTTTCNLGCHHCSVESEAPLSTEVSSSLFFRIVDEACSLGASELLISGGEPLMRRDIFHLIDYASHKQKVNLLTNGTLIRKEEAEKLKISGVSNIVISLDGASPQTHDRIRGKGSFERVLRGIDSLRKEGLSQRITLNCCLSKVNLGEALDFLSFAEKLGIRKVTFLPVKKLGRASGEWQDLRLEKGEFEEFLLALYERFFQPDFSLEVNFPLSGFHPVIKPGERVSTCPFGSQLIINGKGDIYTCPALFIPEFHLGNVLEMTIEEALNSTKMKKLIKKYRARVEKILRCKNCAWRSFCRAACASTVFLEKGTLWQTDDLCEMRDRLYRRAIVAAVRKKRREEGVVHAEGCSA